MGQKIDDPFHIEIGETCRRGGVPQRRHRRKLLTAPGFGPFDHRAHRILELAEQYVGISVGRNVLHRLEQAALLAQRRRYRLAIDKPVAADLRIDRISALDREPREGREQIICKIARAPGIGHEKAPKREHCAPEVGLGKGNACANGARKPHLHKRRRKLLEQGQGLLTSDERTFVPFAAKDIAQSRRLGITPRGEGEPHENALRCTVNPSPARCQANLVADKRTRFEKRALLRRQGRRALDEQAQGPLRHSTRKHLERFPHKHTAGASQRIAHVGAQAQHASLRGSDPAILAVLRTGARLVEGGYSRALEAGRHHTGTACRSRVLRAQRRGERLHLERARDNPAVAEKLPEIGNPGGKRGDRYSEKRTGTGLGSNTLPIGERLGVCREQDNVA